MVCAVLGKGLLGGVRLKRGMLGGERCERCSGDKEGELEKIGSRLEVAGRRRDEEEGRVNDLVWV